MSQSLSSIYPRSRSRNVIVTCAAGMVLAAGVLLSLHVALAQEAPPSDQHPTTGPAEWVPPPQTGDMKHEPDRQDPAENAQTAPPAAPKDELLWKMITEFYPERVAQLKALRDRDPRKFAQVEHQMRPWLRELHEARSQNPKLAELMLQQHHNEMDIHDWQGRYNAAPPQDRQALLEDGRKLAETRVDLRLQREQMRVQMLEKRLHDLKTGLAEREAHKSKIVDRELETISSPPAPHPAKPAP